MEYPATQQEAQDHIEQIRRTNHARQSDNSVENLQVALQLLSEQLYRSATHFLFELVQNADDNVYAETPPSLRFHYENRHLFISCNEVGFSRANVEAICRLGRSSKVAQSNDIGHIGEKGIGFKSVFKIADVAWIKSGHYSFKFDKSEPLGMITPIWADFPFPENGMSGTTKMCLRLSADSDEALLIRNLKSFESRLLLFLRNLSFIEISIKEEPGDEFSTSISRKIQHTETKDLNMVSIQQDNCCQHYLVLRHTVENMPSDPTRPGYKQSNILLAFPVKGQGKPVLQVQEVFAFLPIRDYGFMFVIQGDFLLVANREDIDSSRAWNISLEEAVPYAFLTAVLEFNKQVPLRYKWMRYISKWRESHEFFSSVELSTMELLREQPILESMSGEYKQPQDLFIVPEAFCGDRLHPLLLYKETEQRYLCSEYARRDWPSLEKLGVRHLTPDDFMDDLEYYLEHYKLDYQASTDDWHTSLCQSLLALWQGDICIYKDRLSKLKFIPTEDGFWVAPKDQKLFFANVTDIIELPLGFPAHLLPSKIRRDSPRGKLYQRMGVKLFTPEECCRTIADLHADSLFDPNSLTRPELISHAHFLHKHGWKNASRRRFWFISADGTCALGRELYVESRKEFGSHSWPLKFTSTLRFLHDDYQLSASSEAECDEDWDDWLAEAFNFNIYPPLVKSSANDAFSLSADFRLLMAVAPAVYILGLLSNQWDRYAPWIDEAVAMEATHLWEKCSNRLKAQLGEMRVICMSGVVMPLKATTLPASGIYNSQDPHELFLDVPNPEHPSWLFLRHLGVDIAAEGGSYLKQLRALCDQDIRVSDATRIYQYLELDGPSGKELRPIFANERLIFIPSRIEGAPGTWVSSNSCRWTGPDTLQKTSLLEQYYPSLHWFFRSVLMIDDAGPAELIQEALQISLTDDLDYIAKLFSSISKSAPESDDSVAIELIEKLATSRIFPIRSRGSSLPFDNLLSASKYDIWLIADRPHLHRAFDGIINLLAFDHKQIGDMSQLFKLLNLDRRLLSEIVSEFIMPDGDSHIHEDYTLMMRSKAPLIASMASTSSPEKRREIYEALRTMDVFEATRIMINWSFTSTDGSAIESHAEEGRVKLEYGDPSKNLSLYLTSPDIAAGSPPLELLEELLKFCNIEDPSKAPLLHQILTISERSRCVQLLERRGVLIEFLDEPLDYHLDSTKTAMQQSLTTNNKRQAKKNLKDFVKSVESASSVEAALARDWSRDNHALLAKISSLDNQNHENLLPILGVKKAGVFNLNHPNQSTDLSISDLTISDLFTKLRTEHNVMFEAIYVPVSKTGRPWLHVSAQNLNNVEEEAAFLGELTFSRLLESYLGDAFQPHRHWTSDLRTKAGYPPYEPDSMSDTSSFTICDTSNSFSSFLKNSGFNNQKWRARSTFHIEVITSNGDLTESSFYLRGSQMAKSQRMSFAASGTTVSEVFILVRIYDIHEHPKIAIFVDPWNMINTGSLSVTNMASHRLSFENIPNHLSFEGRTIGSFKHSRSKSKEKVLSRGLKKYMKSSTSSTTPTTSGQPYVYEPLKRFRDIRLFELLPGKSDEPLKATIVTTSLNQHEQYEAVSYCWGSQFKPYQVLTAQGFLSITHSLNGALKRLRNTDKSVLLWVDTICINQDDPKETSDQIRLMRDIFQGASKVNVWIGDTVPGSNEAMQTLLQIRMKNANLPQWPEDIPKVPESWQLLRCPDMSDPIWSKIAAIFAREWFIRIWIIQEVIFASEVFIYCGDWCLGWDDFYEALKIIIQENPTLRDDSQLKSHNHHSLAAYTVGATRELYRNHQSDPQHTLLQLLELFSYSKSTRRQDKLFALLALATDGDEAVFDPDYISSLDTVILRYASAFVKNGQALNLLQRAGTSKSFKDHSWIPDWLRSVHPRTISTWLPTRGAFSAGGTTQLVATVHHGDRHVLVVKATKVDKVAKVGNVTIFDSDAITYVNSIRHQVQALTSYPTGESLDDLAFCIPIGSASRPHLDPLTDEKSTYKSVATKKDQASITMGPEGAQEQSPNNEVSFGLMYSEVKSGRQFLNFAEGSDHTRQKTWRYWHTAVAFSKRLSVAKFFLTDRGYAGLVPHDAEIGDLVVVIYGASTPFLVRKAKNGDYYQLIGECYAHGLMYGEGLGLAKTTQEELYLI